MRKGEVTAVFNIDDLKKIVRLDQPLNKKKTFKVRYIKIVVGILNFIIRLIKFIVLPSSNNVPVAPKNIVVYTHGILGDNIAALPVLYALKERYNSAEITVLGDFSTKPEAPLQLFTSLPYVDRVVLLNGQPLIRKSLKLLMDPKLQNMQCDVFIDFAPYGNRGWFKAVIREIILARRLAAKHSIGFWIHTKRIGKSFNDVQHFFFENEPRRSSSVLKEIGLFSIENANLLPVNAAVKSNIIKRLSTITNQLDRIVIVNPGGRLDIQRWPVERFADAVRRLIKEMGCTVIMTGSDEEVTLAEDVKSLAGDRSYNWAGKTTVWELIELLRLSMLCLTNDTGTMHLASTLGIPTVAIFGTRMSPILWFPLEKKNVVALFSLIECSYCYSNTCSSIECLNNIQVTDVINAVNNVLDMNSSYRRKSL